MTPEQQRESERASLLFQAALAYMGTQTTAQSMQIFSASVPPVAGVAGSRLAQRWIDQAVAYVKRRRLVARDMAFAYYRYQRAVSTGSTVALPGTENPPYVSLPQLREEFEEALNPPVDPLFANVRSFVRAPSPVPQPVRFEITLPGAELDDEDEIDWQAQADAERERQQAEDERIRVEEIARLDAELAEMEEKAEAEYRRHLEKLALEYQERKLQSLAEDEERRKAIELLDSQMTVNRTANRIQAASSSRQVMNGARGALHVIASSDTKVLGYIRVSSTGDPCYFCAMLITRGFVRKDGKIQGGIYRKHEGTGGRTDDKGNIITFGDLNKYHNACKCYSVPIYDLEQLGASDLFALNRQLGSVWNQVREDPNLGDYPEQRWKNFIRNPAKWRKSLEAAA